MKLQVCGGKFKRTQINIPEGLSDFRPAKSIVREAICNIIQGKINDSTVLDLCAGSSIFAMEMLSRGAKNATAVEKNLALTNFIKQEVIKKRHFIENLNVVCDDAKHFIETTRDLFDIIYFDPPYYEDGLSMLVPKLSNILNADGIVIFEFAGDDKFVSDNYSKFSVRKYGKTGVMIIKKEDLCQ